MGWAGGVTLCVLLEAEALAAALGLPASPLSLCSSLRTRGGGGFLEHLPEAPQRLRGAVSSPVGVGSAPRVCTHTDRFS